MPNKPIIDIDINDKQFKDFYRLFQQYKDDLGEMPEDWKTINDHARKGMDAFSAVVGAMLESMTQAAGHAETLAENLKEATEAQKQFGHAAHAGEKGLKSMADHAKSIAKDIFGVGKFLFKTGAWGAGIFGGLTFGYDKLAQSAVGTQRTARGLGLTTGQLRAFGTDLGRYTSPGTLTAVANAKNSYLGRSMLGLATGLSPQQIMSTDAGTLAGRLLQREHQLWASTPAARRPTLAMLPQYKYLGQTTEDFYRSGAATPEEIRKAQQQYARDAATLNYGNKPTDAFYAFSRQLALAGQAIQTHLIKRLASLGPSLGHLMTTLGNSADILIDQIFTKSNMNAIASGIQTFAGYLGSDRFKSDVSNFVTNMEAMTSIISGFVHKFGFMFGVKDTNQKAAAAAAPLIGGNVGVFHKLAREAIGGSAWTSIKGIFSHFGTSYKLPAGMLQAQAQVESANNPLAISPKGAMGLMQLMPKTAAAHGANPFVPQEAIKAAAQENARNMRTVSNIYREYSHAEHIKMTLAAYNWGIGNLEKDVRKYGHGWEQHLPSETKSYISKVLAAMAQQRNKPAHVVVTNKSGTNVAVSTNAAGL